MNELPAPDLLGTLVGYVLMSPNSLAHNLGLIIADLLGH